MFYLFFFYYFFFNLLFIIKISFYGKKIYNFFNKKWFFDKIYVGYIVQNLFKFSYDTSYKLIDRGIIEILGPMGISFLIYKKSNLLNKFQTGFVYHYSFSILNTLTILIGLRHFLIIFNNTIDFKVMFLLFISLLTFMLKK